VVTLEEKGKAKLQRETTIFPALMEVLTTTPKKAMMRAPIFLGLDGCLLSTIVDSTEHATLSK